MATTLDGYTLSVVHESFRESVQYAGVQWDAWESSAYKRKHRAIGKIKAWTLECIEQVTSTTWANSAANHLYSHVADGAALSFAVAEGSGGAEHSVSTTVCVLSVEVWYSPDLTIRYFSLQLQES